MKRLTIWLIYRNTLKREECYEDRFEEGKEDIRYCIYCHVCYIFVVHYEIVDTIKSKLNFSNKFKKNVYFLWFLLYYIYIR